MGSDERVTFRRFTADERRTLEEHAALPLGLAMVAWLALGAFAVPFGALWLAGRWIPLLAKLAVPAGAGLAAYVVLESWRWRRRARAARAALRAPLTEDLQRGEAEVVRYDVVDALRVEELEDEGTHWFLRLRDGRVLFLSDPHLAEAGAFPAPAVEVSRSPLGRVLLGVRPDGVHLPPSAVLPPFPARRARDGDVPSDGDVLDVDFEAIRRGEAFGNARRGRRGRA